MQSLTIVLCCLGFFSLRCTDYETIRRVSHSYVKAKTAQEAQALLVADPIPLEYVIINRLANAAIKKKKTRVIQKAIEYHGVSVGHTIKLRSFVVCAYDSLYFLMSTACRERNVGEFYKNRWNGILINIGYLAIAYPSFYDQYGITLSDIEQQYGLQLFK